MPPAISGDVASGNPLPPRAIKLNGVDYQVVEQNRRVTNVVTEQAFLRDLEEMGVWPGLIIEGRALLSGEVSPIGPLPRVAERSKSPEISRVMRGPSRRACR